MHIQAVKKNHKGKQLMQYYKQYEHQNRPHNTVIAIALKEKT